MNDTVNNNVPRFIYYKLEPAFVEQLKKFSEKVRKPELEKIPSKQEQLPRNTWGIPRIAYYGGFTPWTNIPIANKNGGIV